MHPNSSSTTSNRHQQPVAEGRDRPAEQLPRPLIEIGWIIAGRLEEPDHQAAQRARQSAAEWLQTSYPAFEWRMPVVEREEAVVGRRVEPVQLLDESVTERDLRHWDFTLVITSADLASHYKADALSAVSRSLQAAVISTVRIDPRAYQPAISSQERIAVMASRIKSLVLHAIGRLAGLEHAEDEESFMSAFDNVEDLDKAKRLGPQQAERLERRLHEVADSRLEEQTDTRRAWTLRFYLQAACINWRHILAAVVQAKPWEFPFRLSRLTTAAASAMVVLMITAEAWELALGQSVRLLAGLAVASIVLTTVYVVARQGLFVRREHSPLSELSVVTNVSTFAIVFAGMTTTFLFLAAATLLFGGLLFRPALVDRWAPAAEWAGTWWGYGRLAALVASVGMFVGALGASFESNYYFRHITFVDEEI